MTPGTTKRITPTVSAQQQKTKPVVSNRRHSEPGRTASTSEATAQEMGDSNAMWEHIKPHVQTTKTMPQTGHVPQLITLPWRRDVQFNPNSTGFHASIPKDISALIIQLAGEPAPFACNRCKSGRGPFQGCYVLPTTAPAEQQRNIISCGNCLYHCGQTNCNLQDTLKDRFQTLFPDIDPSGVRLMPNPPHPGGKSASSAREMRASLPANRNETASGETRCCSPGVPSASSSRSPQLRPSSGSSRCALPLARIITL